MEHAETNLLADRPIFHTTPLQNLPSIIYSGELRCQRLLGYAAGRTTARRRDRILNVDQHVHCSLKAETPLLYHKLAKGYPHVVLQLSTSRFGEIPWTVLPCSTKAWRPKWQCQPASDIVERDHYLRTHDLGARYQGLEILVPNRLPLTELTEIITFSEDEAAIIRDLCDSVDQFKAIPVTVRVPRKPVGCCADNLSPIVEYFTVCRILNQALPPPKLAFD